MIPSNMSKVVKKLLETGWLQCVWMFLMIREWMVVYSIWYAWHPNVEGQTSLSREISRGVHNPARISTDIYKKIIIK